MDIGDYVGHYLYFGFKDEAIEKLMSLCTPDSHVVDVGVNVGWTLLNFGKKAVNGKIIGFEPDPVNFAAGSENMRLNDFRNVLLLQVGLGNQKGQKNMEVRTPSNRGANRVGVNDTPTSAPITILPLDEVSEITQWPRVDLIKIDVEGYELNVLRGASSLLARFKPILFIELDEDNLAFQGDSARELVNFLKGAAYTDIQRAETGEKIAADFDFTHCHFDIIAR